MNVIKTLVAALAVAGIASTIQTGAAEAKGCVSCKVPISKTNVKTVTKTRTVEQVRNVTRVNNVTKNRYVKNVTRVVTRTVIVPVTRVNTITRVHNRTFVINATQNVSRTERQSGRTVAGWSRTETVNHRPVTVRQCGCGN